MQRTDRVEEGTRASQQAAEALGYARCEVDQAAGQLADLQQRRDELRRQIEAARVETDALENELIDRLSAWQRLEQRAQRLDDVWPRFQAVTKSLTYRASAGLLAAVNRLRRGFRRR